MSSTPILPTASVAPLDPVVPQPLDALPELVVGYAANVQPGQLVGIEAQVGQEWMVRRLAAAAYARGARFVDVSYFDPYVKRARLLHGEDRDLAFVPSWYGGRLLALEEQGAALIMLRGNPAPHALADVDPARAGRDALPALAEMGRVITGGATNWTLAPCPTPRWAQLVFPDLGPEGAWRRLCAAIARVCRLDAADPVAAWDARLDELEAIAARINGRCLDRVRFEGPGTDLTVGLLPTSRFAATRATTDRGVTHLGNLPSEEVFASPDPARVDGVVRATKPLALSGVLVTDIELELRDGLVTRVDASANAEVLRGVIARDAGAGRLGEVALVDDRGRISETGLLFYETLLDENAASHIALGRAYPVGVGETDRERINRSAIHVDVMIGGPDVRVTGHDADGGEHPLLVDGRWALEERP